MFADTSFAIRQRFTLSMLAWHAEPVPGMNVLPEPAKTGTFRFVCPACILLRYLVPSGDCQSSHVPDNWFAGTCQSVFLLACLFGLLAVVAAAFAMFLLPGGGTIKDMDTLTQAILDWMNTLSGTSTLI